MGAIPECSEWHITSRGKTKLIINDYAGLPPVSSKVASRRLKLAGHCIRHPEEEASKLVLWEPSHGRRNVGRRAVTYVDVLKQDTGLETTDELKTAMIDRSGWK